MRGIVQWIKTHKIIVIFGIIILYFVLKNNPRIAPFARRQALPFSPPSYNVSSDTAVTGSLGEMPKGNFSPEFAPTVGITNRMVVQNSSLSLLVDDVATAQSNIIQKAQALGGYMVNSTLTRPQDAPNATVTIRVPADSLDEALRFFRGLSVKVISENLEGEDVTDQYVDIDARLVTLLKTKTKFEEIMDQATAVQDILTVQRELINLQTQIDNLKGQQNYLAKNAQMAKITIYLSTDELALPYAPSESWRPGVIFKEAVRSLIGFLRKIATAAIWLGVYSVILIPAGLIAFMIYRRKHNPPSRLN